MKKILITVLILVMCFGFVSCSDASDDPAKDGVTDIRDFIPGIENTEFKLMGYEAGSGGGTWGEPAWIPVTDEENARIMDLMLAADMEGFESVEKDALVGTSWRYQVALRVFTDTTEYYIRLIDFEEDNRQIMTIFNYDLSIENYLDRAVDSMIRDDNAVYLVSEGHPFDYDELFKVYQEVLHDKADPAYYGKVTDLATGKSFDMQKYWVYAAVNIFEGFYSTEPLDTAPDAEYELEAEINGVTYLFDIDEGYFERSTGSEKGYGNVDNYKNQIWMYCLAETPNNVENDW
ncbi:MAG: hypothetical protein IKM19_05050 [Firmicutes bacterium]|nr:hypothetical protein [Bacillota bacterium]